MFGLVKIWFDAVTNTATDTVFFPSLGSNLQPAAGSLY